MVATILSDVEDITHTLTTNISHPPLLPHTPPIASKLLWLHGLGERISGVMNIVQSAAPELLEGEQGWKLRQTYGELTDKLQRYTIYIYMCLMLPQVCISSVIAKRRRRNGLKELHLALVRN